MTDEPGRLYSWEEVRAEMDARDAAHAARPWPLRRSIDAYHWVRRACGCNMNPSLWQRGRWRIQRARRGWSDIDAWNLNRHLAAVIAGSAAHLRANGHGHPQELTPQEWDDILARIVAALSVDLDRDVDGEEDAAMLTRREREAAAQTEAVHLVATWWHHLWD